jgi:two-component system, NarL family, nitrate/nitrite response regulator NarL
MAVAPKDRVRILFVENQTLLRAGLRDLIDRNEGLEVVGEAADVSEGERLTSELLPDVVLIDVALAIPFLQRAETRRIAWRALLIAANSEKSRVVEAFHLGARGVVLEDSATEVLVKSIRSVARGKYWAADRPCDSATAALRAMAEPVVRSSQPANTFGLTPRELEILTALVAGYSNLEIARKLKISDHTVKHHVTHLFDKLGVYNRLELALFAIHHGLTSVVSQSDIDNG